MIAVALADGFLAAEGWDLATLRAAGHDVVGPERSFVGAAVVAALEAFPRPPTDAPRALADVLVTTPRLVSEHARRIGRRPVAVLARRVAPVRAGRHVEGPLVVDTLPELARALDLTVGRLLWLADTKGWNRRADPDGPLHHYRHTWTVRPGRTPRLLEAPMHLLRRAQRTVLDELLATLPVHEAAHGFVPGRSVVTSAALHVGTEVVVTMDLTAFFATVGAPSVYGVFRRAGLAEPLAHVLTGLCVHEVPQHVLRAMPSGGAGSVDERSALRRALAEAHLPQGAPTSPALANLVLRHLDARLAGWAAAAGATYTRYADDLTFSGGAALAARVGAFVAGVERIVRDQGHAVNPHKTRVRRRGVRQSVTGVVVNDRLSPGRAEVDRLHAILHNCVRSGPDSQNRDGHPEFRAHLLGRIGWVGQTHPGRAARLRAEFDRIDWS